MEAIPELTTKVVSDVYYLAAILAINGGLGRPKLTQAIGLLGSAKAVYEADEQILASLGYFTAKQINKHCLSHQKDYPEKLQRQCEALGIHVLTIYEEEYPSCLKQIVDPPLVLYVMGEIPKDGYAVGVVGSRACTTYGEQVTRYFSYELAQKGIPIISGGARGIDTIAHEGCLRAGCKTVAVLGCGLDIAYPEENKDLFRRIAEQGAVVSEYPPGVKPFTYNFPARNRIIVGLSQAILVTEAASKSGALITAHLAADEGREVYCVPGSIFSGKSVGCHDLLRKGAKPVDRVQDILEDKADWQARMDFRRGNEASLFDYQMTEEEQKAYEQQQQAAKERRAAERLAKKQQAEAARQRQLEKLNAAAQKIYAYIKHENTGLEALIEKSGENFMTVSMAVLDLQVAGLIVEEGLQSYHRV